ncbi:metal-dependent hydrolase [Halospeciosus flavus]|uniref:metal-dependent hydrolase n=1 Tax=Halospeciosus flavus TaxID=3032283 RepID=UPI0036112B75
MWPWEHLAVGYVAVSILFRWHGRRVGALDAVAVGVGAAFPDLVDKPLAWAFDVLPSGTSVAHSVFVAVPLAVAVWFVAARRDRRSVGAAFAVSYLLHLPSDALYGPLTDGGSLSGLSSGRSSSAPAREAVDSRGPSHTTSSPTSSSSGRRRRSSTSSSNSSCSGRRRSSGSPTARHPSTPSSGSSDGARSDGPGATAGRRAYSLYNKARSTPLIRQ